MSRISVKIKAARSSVGIKFTMPKLFVPADCKTPATAKDSMARQLYQAGIISKADYEKMLGVVYDGDFDPDLEDFDDEAFSAQKDFEQSPYASYDDFVDIAPDTAHNDPASPKEAKEAGDSSKTLEPVSDGVQPDSSGIPVSNSPGDTK